jgi:hypothetical protein
MVPDTADSPLMRQTTPFPGSPDMGSLVSAKEKPPYVPLKEPFRKALINSIFTRAQNESEKGPKKTDFLTEEGAF